MSETSWADRLFGAKGGEPVWVEAGQRIFFPVGLQQNGERLS